MFTDTVYDSYDVVYDHISLLSYNVHMIYGCFFIIADRSKCFRSLFMTLSKKKKLYTFLSMKTFSSGLWYFYNILKLKFAVLCNVKHYLGAIHVTNDTQVKHVSYFTHAPHIFDS